MRINKEYCFFICFGRKVMLRCSLTSRRQCQCKPNAELENSFSKVMLRCSLTSRQQCQCKPNAERRELALKSYAEVQPDFATAKIQHEYPVLQIFSLPNIAPRKFATPSNRHSALYLRAFLRIFHTRKKMKSGYNFLSHADAQNVRSSHVLPPPMPPPHLFATDPCFFLP